MEEASDLSFDRLLMMMMMMIGLRGGEYFELLQPSFYRNMCTLPPDCPALPHRLLQYSEFSTVLFSPAPSSLFHLSVPLCTWLTKHPVYT